MKKFHVFLLVFTFGWFSVFSGSSYPKLDTEVSIKAMGPDLLDEDALFQFLEEWSPDTTGELSLIQDELQDRNREIKTLESVAAIQKINLERTESSLYPKLSINSPLYGYVQNTSLNTSVTPPVTVSLTSHSYGLSGTVSKNLISGGNVSMDLSSASSVRTVDGGTTWTWYHTPSLSLSFSQPLGINDKVVDFKYGDVEREMEEQAYGVALNTVELSIRELTLEALSILQRYQSMREQRYISVKSVEFQNLLYERALDRESKGAISRDALHDQYLALNSAILEVDEIDRQISLIKDALIRLALSENMQFEQFPEITREDIERVLSLYGTVLISDAAYKEKALSANTAYNQAILNHKNAQLSKFLGSPSDAPVISLALNYTPFSTPTAGSSFTDSLSGLFSSSTDHNISVSVLFNANDVFRGERKRLQQQLDQQLMQFELEVERAREEVRFSLEDLQLRINQSINTLEQRLNEYVLAARRLENAKIRNSYGVSDILQLQQSEITMYRSAFSLLDSLRTVYILGNEVFLPVIDLSN